MDSSCASSTDCFALPFHNSRCEGKWNGCMLHLCCLPASDIFTVTELVFVNRFTKVGDSRWNLCSGWKAWTVCYLCVLLGSYRAEAESGSLPVLVPAVGELHQEHELDEEKEDASDSPHVAPHCSQREEQWGRKRARGRERERERVKTRERMRVRGNLQKSHEEVKSSKLKNLARLLCSQNSRKEFCGKIAAILYWARSGLLQQQYQEIVSST